MTLIRYAGLAYSAAKVAMCYFTGNVVGGTTELHELVKSKELCATELVGLFQGGILWKVVRVLPVAKQLMPHVS